MKKTQQRPWLRRRRAVLLTSGLLLTGCAADSFKTACPVIVPYDMPSQIRAADEVAGLPDGSELLRYMEDYASLRDQVRACEAQAR